MMQMYKMVRQRTEVHIVNSGKKRERSLFFSIYVYYVGVGGSINPSPLSETANVLGKLKPSRAVYLWKSLVFHSAPICCCLAIGSHIRCSRSKIYKKNKRALLEGNTLLSITWHRGAGDGRIKEH